MTDFLGRMAARALSQAPALRPPPLPLYGTLNAGRLAAPEAWADTEGPAPAALRLFPPHRPTPQPTLQMPQPAVDRALAAKVDPAYMELQSPLEGGNVHAEAGAPRAMAAAQPPPASNAAPDGPVTRVPDGHAPVLHRREAALAPPVNTVPPEVNPDRPVQANHPARQARQESDLHGNPGGEVPRREVGDPLVSTMRNAQPAIPATIRHAVADPSAGNPPEPQTFVPAREYAGKVPGRSAAGLPDDDEASGVPAPAATRQLPVSRPSGPARERVTAALPAPTTADGAAPVEWGNAEPAREPAPGRALATRTVPERSAPSPMAEAPGRPLLEADVWPLEASQPRTPVPPVQAWQEHRLEVARVDIPSAERDGATAATRASPAWPGMPQQPATTTLLQAEPRMDRSPTRAERADGRRAARDDTPEIAPAPVISISIDLIDTVPEAAAPPPPLPLAPILPLDAYLRREEER